MCFELFHYYEFEFFFIIYWDDFIMMIHNMDGIDDDDKDRQSALCHRERKQRVPHSPCAQTRVCCECGRVHIDRRKAESGITISVLVP